MKPIDLFRAGFWGSGDAASIIAGLFAQGQQGFWLPFTDFASLSQDAAGTLPYTALEQPVGLILDKSKGGGRGPELSPNGGTFDDAAGWTITQPTSSISGGVLNVGAGACDIFPSTASVVAGKSYEVTFTISNSTANYGIRILNRDIISAGNYFPAGAQYITANGSYRFVCVAISNGSIGVDRVIGHTGSLQVDNFSVKEIPGNHAAQVTSTARGVVSALVNLLGNSEFAGNSGVDGTNYSFSTLSGYLGAVRFSLHPSGGYAYKSGSPAVGLTCVFSVVVKMDDGSAPLTATQNASSDFMLVVNGNPAQAASTVPLGGGLYRLTTAPILINSGNIGIVKYAANSAKSFTATAYSLVPVAQAALPYQRVTTPSDYDSVGFPKYLRLDGTDDFYTCGGGGSTTGFYYSDVVMPTTSTFSALLADNTASGGYLVQRTNTGIFFSANAGAALTSVSLPLAANVQAFVSAMDDGVNLTLQVNGAEASIARPVVTAGSSTMYLGRYTTIAQYFSGSMTEPIYRAGPPPSAYERGVIRAYQMQKAGML